MHKSNNYNWSYLNLIERWEYIERIVSESKNIEFIQLCELDKERIDYYYDDRCEKLLVPNDTKGLMQLFEECKNSFHNVSFLFDDFKRFHEITTNYSKGVTPPKKNSLSKNDLLDLTHDFYKSLGKYYYNIFMKLFVNRKDHIIFDFYGERANFQGETIVLPTILEAFIEIDRNFTIDDVFTLTHEYMHAISSIINPHHISKHKALFTELDPLFIELLLEDFLWDNLKDENVLINRNYRHNIFCEQLDDLYIRFKLMEEEENSPSEFKSKKELTMVASKLFNLDSINLMKVLKEGACEDEIYINCYLFAIELYNLAKIDKEKALILLKKIIYLRKEYPYDYYQKIKSLGLIPNTHMQEYHNMIEEDILRRVRIKKNNG